MSSIYRVDKTEQPVVLFQADGSVMKGVVFLSACAYSHIGQQTLLDLLKEKGARKGKQKVLTVYEIDYNKCLFCELCVDPCPVDCIHMGQQYDLASFDRTEHVKIDFMNGEGPLRTARTSAHPDAGLRRHIEGKD